MRLISLDIRNFRIHQSLRIEFDRKLTLIGGPNESGKSTIAEAIHKALFLKSKGSTEDHRAVKSHIHSGDPEVELVFEVQGIQYTVSKRFSGHNGSTKLSSPAITTLHDDSAEDKLSELLQTETGLTKSAYACKWENLWIWQGNALHDPQRHANDNRNDLIRGLQQQGAAAVIQSAADLAVSGLFIRRASETFTEAGKPRRNSMLATACEKLEERRNEYNSSRAQLNNLERAAVELDDSLKAQERNERSLVDARNESQRLTSLYDRLNELKFKENDLLQKLKWAGEDLNRLFEENRKVEELKIKTNRTRNELDPMKQRLADLKQSIKTKQTDIKNKDEILNDYAQKIAILNKHRDYYQNLKRLHTLENEVQRLKNEKKRIVEKQTELDHLRVSYRALPDINEQLIDRIEKLVNKKHEIEASINAIATSVEILENKLPIKINSKESNQKKFVFTDDATIEIGTDAKLRIIPGGGLSLHDHKTELKKTEQELDSLLLSCKVKSLKDAREIRIQRDQLENNIEAAERYLIDFNSDKIEKNLIDSQGECEAVSRLDKEYAAELQLDSRREIQYVEDKINELNRDLEQTAKESLEKRTERDALREKIDFEINNAEVLQGDIEKLNTGYTGDLQTIQYLEKTHGDESVRSGKIQEAEKNKRQINESLREVQDAIFNLNPDQLEADLKRIKRSIENFQSKSDDLIGKVSGLKAVLFSDGSEDPREKFDRCDKLLKLAQYDYDVRKRDAEAVRMLDQLFNSEQEKLSHELTLPFAKKINGYLGCIFRDGVSVKIEDKDGEFKGLSISRKGIIGESPLKFGELSGGAREQVAAAVRLAMAEVLATDHEGCLPVIFDDAFAYSDPQRIETIQSMLDYAANTGGLQVIVFSCNPEDYKFLGAKEVMLK